MPISFPSNPANGQRFRDPTSGNQYQWNGQVWIGFSPLTISGDFVGIGSTTPQFPLTVGFSTLGVDVNAGAAATSLYVQGSVTVTDRLSAAKVVGATTFVAMPAGDLGNFSAASSDAFGITLAANYDLKVDPPGSLRNDDLGAL